MAKKADSTYVNYMRYHLENLNNKTIGFDFFIEPILQSTDEELSSTQLRDIFTRFFKHLTGIEPYTECPLCGAELLPHEGYNKYYISCERYPESCKFIANQHHKYTSRDDYLKDIDEGNKMITEVLAFTTTFWLYLAYWADTKAFDYSKGRAFIRDFSNRITAGQHITHPQAKYALDLYKKAKLCGFDYHNDYEIIYDKIEKMQKLPIDTWHNLLKHLIANDADTVTKYTLTSFITYTEKNRAVSIYTLIPLLSIYENALLQGFQV